jgi:alpha/beta hydrolase family protein
MISKSLPIVVGALAAIISCDAQARITKITITKVESPTFEGRSFGNVGAYEKLVGRVTGEVDPADPHNAIITDIALAPRNAAGKVEYETDIMIFRPVDRSKGNHKTWYELTNRGNIAAFSQFNDGPYTNNPSKAADAGNGFLMTQGYSILISGWDTTAPAGAGRFTTKAPVAVNKDGSAIVGPAMEEFVVDDAKTTSGKLTYPAATLDKSQASLTVRVRTDDPPTPIAADKWDYANEAGTAIKLAGNVPFQQGTLYEFVYHAKDPVVSGLGFAALRDLASFAKNAEKDDAGTANPLQGDASAIFSACVSQPCRTMHDFVLLGFNNDESNRKVVDGVVNWIGGATGVFMNYRFAEPFRTQRQHIARHFPEFQAPFTNQVMLDSVTGKTDGRLKRCLDSNTCPKIFEVNSENEYWSKDMAQLHVDAAGKDIGEPDNVRAYLMASLPHNGGTPASGIGICQQERNPLVANAVLRALLLDMDAWVTKGTAPPASRLPRVADGTLVKSAQADVGFPVLAKVTYTGRMHTGDLFDFGPDFDKGILTVLPPKLVGTPYPALVPKTDADGNDIAGIRLPEVAVPTATYTGWGLRAVPSGGNDGCDHFGQKIVFATTKAERMASGDPRPSLQERYPNHDDYVAKVTQAAMELKNDRLLLDDDVQAYMKKAQDSAVGK